MEPDRLRNANPPRISFSKIEVRDIIVSVLVLSLAFMLMYRNSAFVTEYFKVHLGNLWGLALLALMIALVTLSFVTHEMGHKFTAQRMGLWSEYRMFPMGLLLALVMSLVGFLFAAPGVVYIEGYVDRDQDGKISVAGPAVNLILAIVGLAGCFALNGSVAVVFFYLLFMLNSALALFNLLPIGILDGAKVMRWDNNIWIICFIVAVTLFISPFAGLLPDLHYYL